MDCFMTGSQSRLLLCYMLAIAVTTIAGYDVKSLKQLSSCSCETHQGVVDLTPLANPNGSPRFKDVKSNYPNQYPWNPCYPFTEAGCRDVAGCHLVMYYSLSTQDSVLFQLSEDGLVQLVYHSNTARLFVTLKCQEGDIGTLEAKGERPSKIRTFARPRFDKQVLMPQAVPCERKYLDGVGCLLLAHVAGGTTYQIFIHKASGLQMIPNIAFWNTLPGLL